MVGQLEAIADKELKVIADGKRPNRVFIKGFDIPSVVFEQISSVLERFYQEKGHVFYAEREETRDSETGELVQSKKRYNPSQREYNHKVYGEPDIECKIVVTPDGKQTQRVIEKSDGFHGYLKLIFRTERERTRSHDIEADYAVGASRWTESGFTLDFNLSRKKGLRARTQERDAFVGFVNRHYF